MGAANSRSRNTECGGGIFIDGVQTIQGLSFSSVGQRSLGKGLEVQSIHDHECMGIKVARPRLVTQGTPV